MLIGSEEAKAGIPQIVIHCSPSRDPPRQRHPILLHPIDMALLPRILVPPDHNSLIISPEKQGGGSEI